MHPLRKAPCRKRRIQQPDPGTADRGVASRRGDFRFLSAVLLINKV
jgi:hypothetical protein